MTNESLQCERRSRNDPHGKPASAENVEPAVEARPRIDKKKIEEWVRSAGKVMNGQQFAVISQVLERILDEEEEVTDEARQASREL